MIATLKMKRKIVEKSLELRKSRMTRKKEMLKSAVSTSYSDLTKKIDQLAKDPTPAGVLHFVKLATNSGVWIGRSYYRYLKAVVDGSKLTAPESINSDHFEIIRAVTRKEPIDFEKNSMEKVFSCIYEEIEYCHATGQVSGLKCSEIAPTIVLVSGVLNEIFSTAAFERGVSHLSRHHSAEYFIGEVDGMKSSEINSRQLATQLNSYIEKHPDKKIWLMAFSKGGIDCLHFLRENKEFAEKYIVGLSTIACPILGSDHVHNRLIQLLNSVHRLSDTKLYKFIDKKKDILAKEFQKSLSSKYLRSWFEKNHEELPQNIFYSAIGLEAAWYESHVWMILAKIFLPSTRRNDGVVDIDSAFFPDYFKACNLGTIHGHHLIGTRSSEHNQEALLEALVIFLQYLNRL